ncbi:hypothetical protein BDV18DRAFT_144284 [Aspergillus unguis]
MSRTPPSSLQKWGHLQHRSLLFLTPSARPSFLTVSNDHLSRKTNNRGLCQTRLFHTTPAHNAVRAPSTRRKQAVESGRRNPPPSRSQGPRIVAPEPQDSLVAQIEFLEKNGLRLATEMLADGIIDQSIRPKQVTRICASLLQASETLVPSKTAITDIARDQKVNVETIFEIGRAFTRGNKTFYTWLIDSSMDAGVPMAIYLTALNHLNLYQRRLDDFGPRAVSEPPFSRAIAQVESLATRSNGEAGEKDSLRDPRAMLIYAKYLGLRGQNSKGIKVIKELLELITPTRTQSKPSEDLRMSGLIDTPWGLHLKMLRQRKENDRGHLSTKGDVADGESVRADEVEAMRLGAVTYQDPAMLLPYAQHMGEKENIQVYEQHLGQAAAGGNTDACRKLANFYYLTSVGRFPQSGTKPAKQFKLHQLRAPTPPNPDSQQSNKQTVFVDKLLNYFAPRPVDEYRLMAMEWYAVALAKGCLKSGLNLAQLLQLEGDFQGAETTLEDVKRRIASDAKENDYNFETGRLLEANSRKQKTLPVKYLDL